MGDLDRRALFGYFFCNFLDDDVGDLVRFRPFR